MGRRTASPFLIDGHLPRRCLYTFIPRLRAAHRARVSVPRPHRARYPLRPHLRRQAQDQLEHRVRGAARGDPGSRRPDLAGQLSALRSGILRSRGEAHRTWSQPLQGKSVNYVPGINCKPWLRNGPDLTGAATRSRTLDLLITSELLYRLSYGGSRKLYAQLGVANDRR